jgi:predicted house-cleaning noncanonical NTP pyrophosphatase (MazG superfamily)
MSNNLVSAIGVPAMYEQAAEESSELSFACLKMARYIRGENKVHNRTEESLKQNLNEEVADVLVCIEQMLEANLVNGESIDKIIEFKKNRMSRRLMGDE